MNKFNKFIHDVIGSSDDERKHTSSVAPSSESFKNEMKLDKLSTVEVKHQIPQQKVNSALSVQIDSKNNFRQLTIDSLPMMENHPEGKVTIVHMSDSHISHQYLKSVPDGDIFIHSGDISHKSEWYDLEDKINIADPNASREDLYESVPSIISFNEWVSKLPHKIKIVIGGNHEIGFNGLSRTFIQNKILNNVIYLQDQQLIINYRGGELLKIYGTPWTTSSRMAFSMKSDKIALKWEKIPLDTDILITHLPPFGIMDLASGQDPAFYCDFCQKEHKYRRHWGSQTLRNKAIELNATGKLRAHLYGHVHEYHGTCFEPNIKDKTKPLLYSNAACVGSHSDPHIRKPLVFELLPNKIQLDC